MYTSDMRCFFAICFSCFVVAGVCAPNRRPISCSLSNEHSGDVTVIDGNNEIALSATFTSGQTAAWDSRDAGRQTALRYIERFAANGAWPG